MIYNFLVLLVNISFVFSQFAWQDGGLPIRQGVHIEWQRTGDISEDGSIIIAWSDTRNSIRDIYAESAFSIASLTSNAGVDPPNIVTLPMAFMTGVAPNSLYIAPQPELDIVYSCL